MGQVLHGCARTTEAVRREIQSSKESMTKLSERLWLNYKTVSKWKHRDFVHDMPMGPKDPHSTVLTREEEAICVAFRKHSLLPLDDCLYALRESRFRIFRVLRCIDFFSAMESANSLKMKRKSRKRSSKNIRSAIFTLILQRFAAKKASCIYSLQSIVRASSHTSNYLKNKEKCRLLNFWKT